MAFCLISTKLYSDFLYGKTMSKKVSEISLLDYELWLPRKEKICYSDDLLDMNITAKLLVNRYSADLDRFFRKRSGESVTLETDSDIAIKYSFRRLKYEVRFPINAPFEKLVYTVRTNRPVMLTSTAKNLLDDIDTLLSYKWNIHLYHPAGKLSRSDRDAYIRCVLMFFNTYNCSGFSAEQLIHLRELFYNLDVEYENYIGLLYEYCGSKHNKSQLNAYFEKIGNDEIKNLILDDILFMISCGKYDASKENRLIDGVIKLYRKNKVEMLYLYETIRNI